MPTAMRYAAEIALIIVGLLMLMFAASILWPDPGLNMTPVSPPAGQFTSTPVGGR